MADFLCFEAKLIIEVDGGQHDAQRVYDLLRTEWFEERGFRVIRFWNSDVLSNTAGVFEVILQALDDPTLPSLEARVE